MLSTINGLILQALTLAGANEGEASVRTGGKNAHYSVLLSKIVIKSGKTLDEVYEIFLANLPANEVFEKTALSGQYINLWLKNSFVQKWFGEFLCHGLQITPNNKKVLLEWVSANPTGPIHLGHARGAFLGEAIARILAAAGYDVTREYYINDHGNQIEVLGRTTVKRIKQLRGEEVILEEGEYPGQYLVDIAKKLLEEHPDVLENIEKHQAFVANYAAQKCLQMIKQALAEVGIHHTSYVSEASLHASGAVQNIVDEYVKLGATYEAEQAKNHDNIRREGSNSAKHAGDQEGGLFLKTSEHGDSEDRIILRADKTPVYLTADLAYHKHKYERGFDRIVSIFGADHAGHIPRLRAGMTLLGLDETKLETILVQMVAVNQTTEAGLVERMSFSKRAGKVQAMDDLVNDIGADAARLYFASRKADTQMVVDLDKVAKKDAHNTTFYLQYAHARCSGIMRTASENNVAVPTELHANTLACLVEPEEIEIIMTLEQFGVTLQVAAAKLSPVILNTYFQELAQKFHSYYAKHHVVVLTDYATTHARLALVSTIKNVFAIGLGLFGASAPEKM